MGEVSRGHDPDGAARLTRTSTEATLHAMSYDVIVLGAGPAGLGAALAVARAGGRVALVEATDHVGGLCTTLRRRDLSFDLGGHILFVNDARRREWLEGLLGDDLRWVDRPVVCVRDGRITPGRYLDQAPRAPGSDGSGRSAFDVLAAALGSGVTDGVVRRYLEKVDGMPLERITGQRAWKLLVEQAAPTGFWYPAGGIGQLMDAMAAEIRRRGGDVFTETRVRQIQLAAGAVAGVTADSPAGPLTLGAPRVIAGVPAALVARLVDPPPPAGVVPGLRPRAAALVYLQVGADRVMDHAWLQVDAPDVPFARLAEAKNWSAQLVPAGTTVLGCECYCHPQEGDPWWPLDHAALGAACANALAGPLGLIGAPADAQLVEVVRLARAWSLVDVDEVDAAAAPWRWLGEIPGLTVAQGGDVVRAIDAGEAAVGP